jgi:sugar phosphate isomerase/epimerase
VALLDKLSFQLYSARNFPPLDQQLAVLAGLGYTRVEPYGALLKDNTELAAGLERYRLSAPSAHIALSRLQSGLPGAIRLARQLGIELFVVPALAPARRPADAAGWRGLGAELARIQQQLDAAGLRLAWHNHDYELKALAGERYPLDLIFEGAPQLLWQADIGWLERAGADTQKWLELYGRRIVAFHLKDLARAGENKDEDGWADVGFGIVDWQRLLPAMRASSAGLFVVEHDRPADFERFARRSRATVENW